MAPSSILVEDIMGIADQFREALDRELKIATYDIDRILTPKARNNHEYEHQTYNLADNTRSRGFVGIESDFRLVAETEYADFIHNQPWSRGPDPFLDMALIDGRDEVDDRLEEALQRALDSLTL